ncbi:hypothetical protein N2152v2_004552 [Parachlorella kessleri]
MPASRTLMFRPYHPLNVVQDFLQLPPIDFNDKLRLASSWVYELYGDYVLKNPFHEMDQVIKSELFDQNLVAAIGSINRRWVPPVEYQFPEVAFFDLQHGASSSTFCDSPISSHAYSLQYALRLCLNDSNCWALQWDPLSREAQLCSTAASSNPALSKATSASLTSSSVTRYWQTAVRKRAEHDGSSEGCQEGEVVPLGRKNGSCSVCKEGYCRQAMKRRGSPVPDFNARIEAAVSRLYGTDDHYRGYSPAMVTHNGSTHFVVRVANYTKCPYWAGVDAYKLQPPFHTKARLIVALCQANRAMQPYGCRNVPVPVSRMRLPDFGPEAAAHKFGFSQRFPGLEDPRAFSWQGKAHLVGTVNMGNWRGKSNVTVNMVGIARLREDLAVMEAGAVLSCPGTEGKQKNYMPLVVGGQLYVVIQAYPLVVGRVDPGSLGCSLVHKEVRQPFSLRAVLPSGAFLSGGSSFIPTGRGRFLALGHHYTSQGYRRVYYHHFIIVSARETGEGQHHFSLEWVSEAFRLLNGPGDAYGIQFATGLLLKGGSLYLSYGITDCFAGLVVIKDFHTKLRHWEEFGIGSQGR